MEHPGISVTQIKAELTLEQIQEKISELHQKLSFANSMGQQQLINQLYMALECYNRAQMELHDEMFKGDDDVDPTDNIKIS